MAQVIALPVTRRLKMVPASLPPSHAEIERAKAQMYIERLAAGLETVVIPCGRCAFAAEGVAFSKATAEGMAVREIVRHIIREHPTA